MMVTIIIAERIIKKVTPSSKCVGDLALYLVTRGLKASDVTDPAKKGQVDFPDSVVGLLEGRLGFPHKGFPDEVRGPHLDVFIYLVRHKPLSSSSSNSSIGCPGERLESRG